MKKEYRKVNNGIVQVTLPDERWYTNKSIAEIDSLKTLSQDDFYPSVTWIASYYPKTERYMKWLAGKGWDKAEEVKNLAGEKGSRVHHACNNLLMGVEVKMDDKYPDSEGDLKELSAEEYGIIMSFKDWLDEEQPEVLGTEYTVLNHWHKFGGTVDLKCRIKSDGYKNVWIVDLKTSQDVWPSHEIQVSAYLKTELDAQKCAILQIGYNRNKVKKYKFSEIAPQFELFLSIQNVWKKESEGTLVPQKDYPESLQWKKEVVKPLEIKVEGDITSIIKPINKTRKVVRRVVKKQIKK